jgi:hypothetical protein
LPHSIDVWRAAAPALDFLSPDIYFNEFAQWAGWYTRPDNPLFIPETQGGAAGAANALYSFGHLSAIGFSPFGIEDQGNAPVDLAGITIPGEHPDRNAMASVYSELSKLASMILEKQSTGGISAVLMEGEAQRSARLPLGDYTANMTRTGSATSPAARLAAMFLQMGPNEFIVVGSGDAQITFTSDKPGPPIVGIESIDEQFFVNGQWVIGRRLNGDENSQGQSLRLNATDLTKGKMYRVRLYRYH